MQAAGWTVAGTFFSSAVESWWLLRKLGWMDRVCGTPSLFLCWKTRIRELGPLIT